MKSIRRQRSRGIKFDITPMIDVVFNLVIFFLVASHFAKNEASEPVKLPSASETAEEDNNPRRLVITILADGTISIKGHSYQSEAVEQLIREGVGDDPASFAVRFRADSAAEFGMVTGLLKSCAKLGVTQVGFHVIER